MVLLFTPTRFYLPCIIHIHMETGAIWAKLSSVGHDVLSRVAAIVAIKLALWNICSVVTIAVSFIVWIRASIQRLRVCKITFKTSCHISIEYQLPFRNPTSRMSASNSKTSAKALASPLLANNLGKRSTKSWDKADDIIQTMKQRVHDHFPRWYICIVQDRLILDMAPRLPKMWLIKSMRETPKRKPKALPMSDTNMSVV